jgi:hypothetical protein
VTFHEVLLLLVAAATIPAAMRNFTALALVASYAVYQSGWLLTQRAFDPLLCVVIDATVIAAIYCKDPAHDCWPYRDWRHQLGSAWLEKSLWDRIVIAVFPLMWAAYFLPLPAYLEWHSLYWLTMAQFVAANGEALHLLHNRSAKSGETRPDITGMRFIALGGGGYG